MSKITQEELDALEELMVQGMKDGLREEKGRASVIKEVREFLKERGTQVPPDAPVEGLLDDLPFTDVDRPSQSH